MYRTRNQAVLAAVQAARGTEETLDPATDAIKVRAVTPRANFQRVETDYVTDGLDRSQSQTGGGGGQMQLPTFLRGSGTAGTPPDFGVLLRGCAMAQVVTATDVTGALTGTPTTTVLQLAVDASAVDDAYKGMVIEVGGERRAIIAYDGTAQEVTLNAPLTSAPSAGDTYTIPANVLYRPISIGDEVVTIHHFQHHNADTDASRRFRLFDAAGTFGIRLTNTQLAELTFDFSGIIPAKPDDVTKPAGVAYQSSSPRPFMAANAFLGADRVKFNAFSLDLSGTVQQPDDPAATFGYDSAMITDRAPSGRINPQMLALTSRDVWGDWLGGVTRDLWLGWGPSAGNRVSVLCPGIRYTGAEREDVRGFAAEGIPFEAARSDDGVWLCFH